ncbi:MOSC N-terminal beta barrel domain-containing protein [Knoellia sp. S7-12]|uniref:MOSC domain-containing protein n=1 Tax=Knoellia sp. S7-12 TaxID=3126698 RepID=UPI0033695B4B
MTRRLRVQRLGLALIKGTRHTDRDEIELDPHGPVGDRTFCLVDGATQRVLRTVENPSLVQLVAQDLGDRLAVTTPNGHTTEATTQDAADGIQVADYWGRGARIRLQDSELSAAISQHLGREVVLARAERGDVVYADPISMVTTGALHRLSEAITASGYAGPPALDVRFRATVTVDADEDPAPGTRVQLGSAIVEVGEPLERCAVIDLDPNTGERVLPRLLEHVRSDDGLLFGVGARVVRPGRVTRLLSD